MLGSLKNLNDTYEKLIKIFMSQTECMFRGEYVNVGGSLERAGVGRRQIHSTGVPRGIELGGQQQMQVSQSDILRAFGDGLLRIRVG